MKSAIKLAASLVAITALAGCSGSPEETQEEPSVQAEETSQEDEVADDVETNLAEQVEEGINNNFPGGISTGSPLYFITEYEDVSARTIRVYVQAELSDAEREETATHVFNMSGTTADQLSTVVVRDTSGVDSNHYR